jgi:hypothetical protein
MNVSMSRWLSTFSSLRSMSFLSAAMGFTKADGSGPHLSVRQYKPSNPSGPFPYSIGDMTPMEAGGDDSFYSTPRFVTHIDDNAINNLRRYYSDTLPRKGRILDFCSSWVSHYPPEVGKAVESGDLEILGTGMNRSEMSKNPVLKAWSVQDLNEDPDVRLPQTGSRDQERKLDASTCVVSIDYLTKPVEVLASIRQQTNIGGKVHLVISNRCFPTKVVGRWLSLSEDERLEMVGDYLWWSGWREVEIVALVEASWMKDPLWVVRGTNVVEHDGG